MSIDYVILSENNEKLYKMFDEYKNELQELRIKN